MECQKKAWFKSSRACTPLGASGSYHPLRTVFIFKLELQIVFSSFCSQDFLKNNTELEFFDNYLYLKGLNVVFLSSTWGKNEKKTTSY